MSQWQPIETAPSAETVLTFHKDDIYPAVAFQIGGFWMLEQEGPEDTYDRRPGKHKALYRTPTHWMPLPPAPATGRTT